MAPHARPAQSRQRPHSPLSPSKGRPPSAARAFSQMLARASRASRPLAMAAFVILIVFCVWDAPPLLAARTLLCSGTSSPASKVLTGDAVLLDRFAETAAEQWRQPEWKGLSTLVMVAGHAIFTGHTWDASALRDERNWNLEKFQRGQVSTFLKHIERGVQLAAEDSSALLLFSGGQTRRGTGPRSEGLTYWMAADAEGWYGYQESGVQNRTLAEEYARDSMENLLFSVCRFNQVVGRYPHVIKVVSFSFKKIRFIDLHRKAMRFPAHRFEFHGIDPDGTDGMRGHAAGERARAMGPFSADPYGCHTSVLSSKKEVRNPYLRYHPYPQGCPELASLFRHCGRSVFSGPLPWDPRINPDEMDRQR